jgi:protein arginine kinase activator
MSSLICEICKNSPAQLHITRIVNDQVYAIHVCAGCAEEKGLSNPIVLTPLEAVLEQADEAGQKVTPSDQPAGAAVCPGCGKTEQSFRESGNLGCDQCYETFSEGLEGLMTRIQRDTRHIGKVPGRLGTTVRLEADIRRLREQLQEAIKQENFETAARIRDRIRELGQE